MSEELKTYDFPVDHGDFTATVEQFYLKSEADKVIAEKDEEIAGLKVKLKVQTSNAEKAWKLKDSYHTNYAEAVKELYDKNKEIAELKDKCQMHDFFWEGCGFAKRGFKNTIAVSEAFDTLEAENESLLQQNRELSQALQVMYSKEEYNKQKYKRCLAMAEWCDATALWCYQAANTLPAGFHATLYGKPVMIEPNRLFKRYVLLTKWSARWSELAEKFKEAK